MHRLRERGCPEESLLGKTWMNKNSCFCPVLEFRSLPGALTFFMWLHVVLNRWAFRANGAVLWEVWRQTVLHHRPKNIPPSALSWSTRSGKTESRQPCWTDTCVSNPSLHISLLSFSSLTVWVKRFHWGSRERRDSLFRRTPERYRDICVCVSWVERSGCITLSTWMENFSLSRSSKLTIVMGSSLVRTLWFSLTPLFRIIRLYTQQRGVKPWDICDFINNKA